MALERTQSEARLVTRRKIDSIPLFVVAGLLVVGSLGMALVRWLYVRENRRRERMTADWTEVRFAEERNSPDRRGDQRLDFRYTL